MKHPKPFSAEGCLEIERDASLAEESARATWWVRNDVGGEPASPTTPLIGLVLCARPRSGTGMASSRDGRRSTSAGRTRCTSELSELDRETQSLASSKDRAADAFVIIQGAAHRGRVGNMAPLFA